MEAYREAVSRADRQLSTQVGNNFRRRHGPKADRQIWCPRLKKAIPLKAHACRFKAQAMSQNADVRCVYLGVAKDRGPLAEGLVVGK